MQDFYLEQAGNKTGIAWPSFNELILKEKSFIVIENDQPVQ